MMASQKRFGLTKHYKTIFPTFIQLICADICSVYLYWVVMRV